MVNNVNTLYITTPIYYPNAPPHIGHAYTTVFADIIARYYRLIGWNVFFMTGNDEHGLKLQRIAEKMNVDPKKYVDDMAEVFKNYWRMLDIEYDHFIRTTDEYHVEYVKEFVEKLRNKNLIYKDAYSGWYCADCEKFYSEKEFLVKDDKPYCPIHLKPLEWLNEETYYFKLSLFKDYVVDLLKNHNIVYPQHYANEVLNKIAEEGLRDVSIARRRDRVWWGIELPFDKDYTIYVWFDALLNYVTGLLHKHGVEGFNKFWSNCVHVIGKDIVWFHTVVWFSILKALDIDPPKRVLVHAFLLNRGLKMGKSTGNVVTIEEMINRYGGSDPVRYLLARVFNMDKDVDVSFELFDSIYSSELVDNYGNLVRRVGVLALKKTSGVIYRRTVDKDVEKAINDCIKLFNEEMQRSNVSSALGEVVKLLSLGNGYLNKTEPWAKESPEREIYNTLEIIRVSTILLHPFIPRTTVKVAEAFNFKITNPLVYTPQERYEVKNAPILFRKLKNV